MIQVADGRYALSGVPSRRSTGFPAGAHCDRGILTKRLAFVPEGFWREEGKVMPEHETSCDVTL